MLSNIFLIEGEFVSLSLNARHVGMAPKNICPKSEDMVDCPAEVSDVNANYNGQTNFLTYQGPDSRILCRHLVTALFKRRLDSPISPCRLFYLRDNIPAVVGTDAGIVEKTHQQYLENAPTVHFLQDKDWAGFLREAFTSSGGVFYAIITTYNHVLYLQGSRHKEGYQVVSYDPNRTLKEKVIRFNQLAELEQCSITQTLFHDGKLYDVYQVAAGILAGVYTDKAQLGAKPTTQRFFYPKMHHPLHLIMALQFNYAAAIANFMPFLSELPSDTQQFKYLNTFSAGGEPGLYCALNQNYAEAIEAYTALIQALKLTPAQKFELLKAESRQGVPGLYIALAQNSTQAIKAYTVLLTNTQLNNKQLFKLLMAQATGQSGLSVALGQNNAEAIEAYGLLIKKANLGADQSFELLRAVRANGTPGLFSALYRNNAKAIKAYGMLMKQAKLTSEQKFTLLRAVRTDGISGLYTAIQENAAEAIEAYGTLMQTAKLSSKQRLELLKTKNGKGVSDLFAACVENNRHVLKAYTHLIKKAALSSAQNVELLQITANDMQAEGILARQHHNEASIVAAFRGVISQIDLSESDRQLLSRQLGEDYKGMDFSHNTDPSSMHNIRAMV
jgi:hypothetical protein